MTVPEGNLQLHRELREAMPYVALSGEGLDEVTLRYEAFAQRHASHAVDHVHKTWNDAFIACGHPISSFLFLPYATINGYLGMSNPAHRGVYGGWTRAYENWGVIPTLSRPTLAQLRTPDTEAAALLELAGLWTKHGLRPDFSTAWDESTKFRHQGDGAVGVTYTRLPGGGSRCTASVGGRSRDVYRYIHGVNRMETGGSIPGWPAYNRTEVMGLNPAESYFWHSEPRDLNGPHISELPAGLIVARTRCDEWKFVVRIRELHTDCWLDLAAEIGDAHTGIILDGTEGELERGASFRRTKATCAEISRDGIFAHPPWQAVPGRTAQGLGDTFGEFELDLPRNRTAELCFDVGLRDGVEGRSDGVTFAVQVNGEERFSTHWAESEWSEQRVALDDFAGQRVRLRLVTSVGPAGDASFDWAVWGRPRVRLRGDERLHGLVLSMPHQAAAILAGDTARVRPSAAAAGPYTYAVRTTLPAQIACFRDSPARIRAPVSLATEPFTMSATIAGQSAALPLKFVSFGPGTGISGGEERNGLSAHPPNGGRVYADYLLELPEARKLVLNFAVALQDGSQSEACRFLVEANGVELFGELVTGPDGWHPGQADLTHLAGRPILLSLIVDSEGPYSYDWARWAEPNPARGVSEHGTPSVARPCGCHGKDRTRVAGWNRLPHSGATRVGPPRRRWTFRRT